jgi:hypothetical protein
MRCWVCGADAEACCRFCGRGICKTHAKTQPYILQVWRGEAGLQGLAVEDAIWCGVCKRAADVVDLSWLEPDH